MALLIRGQLAAPGMDIIQTGEQYNQLFTMHGHDHAAHVRDAAVRRLRERASCRCRSARRTSRSRASTPSPTGSTSSARSSRSAASSPRRAPRPSGGTVYVPLADGTFSPGLGGATSGCSGSASRASGTILGAVNFITTIITSAPGHDDVADCRSSPGTRSSRRSSCSSPSRSSRSRSSRSASTGCSAGRSTIRTMAAPSSSSICSGSSPSGGLHPRAAVLRRRLGDLPVFSRKPISATARSSSRRSLSRRAP